MTAIGFSSSKTYNGQNTAKSTFVSNSILDTYKYTSRSTTSFLLTAIIFAHLKSVRKLKVAVKQSNTAKTTLISFLDLKKSSRGQSLRFYPSTYQVKVFLSNGFLSVSDYIPKFPKERENWTTCCYYMRVIL